MIIDLLKKYDKAYQEGNPLISDREYDDLKNHARLMFGDDPYFKTVGAPVSGNKIKIGYVIGSLNKTNSTNVQSWIEKYNEVIISEKLDGSGIVVVYNNGKLSWATTRGDGEWGQNITDKAVYFLPKEIKYKSELVLRGEAMLIGGIHTSLGFKNPRNGVAGLLNRKKFKVSDVKHIKVYFHEVIKPQIIRRDMFSFIKELGFDTPRFTSFSNITTNDLIKKMVEWKESAIYETDGIVLADSNSYRENTYYPENVVAFKVNQEAARTKVVDIEWNVGRTGRVIPTIIVEPIVIDGTTISRATGFNAKFVMDNNIKPGTTVGIFKAGEIIPYIDFIED
ncbi:MAG TPA: hypothetical protein P5140_08550 [Methanofastidiosum sp.]|nr:hypothetical protein [Methanofastidiosum sp.]